MSAPAPAAAAAAAAAIKAGPESWIDAQAMKQAHPATFESPSARELSAIKPGYFAKINNGRERFWVEVTAVNRRTENPALHLITGRIDNLLVGGDYGYDFNDLVQFEGRHIHSVHDSATDKGVDE